MLVFGPLRDLEDQDKVHWMRAFSSLEERDRIKDQFYEGQIWHDQIGPVAMSMIEKYEADLTETTDRFEDFRGDRFCDLADGVDR